MSDIIQVNPLVFGGEGESVHANVLTKLWENPSPTVSFAAQNITLSSGDYDGLLWIGRLSTADNSQFATVSEKGASAILNHCVGYNNNGSDSRSRTATYTDDTHFSIGNATQGLGTGASNTNNSLVIPIAVYGFKKSLDITAIVSEVSTDATKCIMSDGVTDVETELNKKVEGWTLAGNVTSTSLVTVTVPNTAKEVLAVLVNPSNVILISQVIPKALMSNGASLKDVANTSKELYSNGSKWKVTDSTYTGKIYYR